MYHGALCVAIIARSHPKQYEQKQRRDMNDFGDMMKQAQKMQAQMQEAQAEIGQMQVQGESGAGLVKVTMNGRHEVSRVEIDPSVLSEEKSVLEDLWQQPAMTPCAGLKKRRLKKCRSSVVACLQV